MSLVPPPPDPPRRAQRRTVHGITVEDEFAWLKADNWKEVLRDPSRLPEAIRAHLEAENAHAAWHLAPLEALRGEIVAALRSRIPARDESVPVPRGPFLYYTRFAEGSEHPLVCRRPRGGGAEQVILDVPSLTAGEAYFDLGHWRVSPRHDRIAFTTDTLGSERFVARIRDIATGAELTAPIPDVARRLAWGGGGEALYVVSYAGGERPSIVTRRLLLRSDGADEPVFEERDPTWFLSVSETRSGAFLLVSLRRKDVTEIHLLDAADPAARPRPLVVRDMGLRCEVDHAGGHFYLRADDGGAEDFRIVAAPVADPRREAWVEIVPHRPGVTLTSHAVLGGTLVRAEREDAMTRIVIRDLAGGAERVLDVGGPVHAVMLEPGEEHEADSFRYTWSDPARPPQTHEHHIPTGVSRLIRRPEMPARPDPDLYDTRWLWADAPDGARVPVSLTHRRGLTRDGSAPCLLYGYGSYGFAVPAGWSAERLALVDHGFVVAIAHVRGGAERGRRWYLDATGPGKPRSFSDFVACGEALVAQGYTGRGRIVAHGRSAGGMLVGGALNLAPDLFAGVIADVPFVDVLATMLDAELPLTPGEWDEWGNPIIDRAAFEAILSYSPYERIAERLYPPVLALGGLTDPRVTYWEPAKWIARLRARAPGGPFLLATDMASGHLGRQGRFTRLDKAALEIAFALRCVANVP